MNHHHCQKNKPLLAPTAFPTLSPMPPAPPALWAPATVGHSLMNSCMSSRFRVGLSLPYGTIFSPTPPQLNPWKCLFAMKPLTQLSRTASNYHIYPEPYQLLQREACSFSVMPQLSTHLSVLTVIICLTKWRGPQSLGPSIYLPLYLPHL